MPPELWCLILAHLNVWVLRLVNKKWKKISEFVQASQLANVRVRFGSTLIISDAELMRFLFYSYHAAHEHLHLLRWIDKHTSW